MDLGLQGQGRRDHRRQRRHRARRRARAGRRRRHVVIAARDGARAAERAREVAGRARHQGRRPSPPTSPPPTAAPQLIAAVDKAFGGCDILINNAGSGSNETIIEAPDEKWQHYWELHVMAAVRLSRGLAPGDEEPRRRGHPATMPRSAPPSRLWYEPIYNVDQGGAGDVLQDPRQRADPVQHPRQRAQSGPRPDPRLDQDRDAADRGHGGDLGGLHQDIAREHAPIKRFAKPEEVASFFVFLCSDQATYSVGSTYYVDGGMLRTVG